MKRSAMRADPIEEAGEAFTRVGRELAISIGADSRSEAKRRAKEVRKALYDPEFERMAFDVWAPTLTRLAGIAALQEEALAAGLLERDRDDIAAELDRYAFRILLRTELIERLLNHSVETYLKAAALLDLVAKGVVTRGRCARLALDTARALLSTAEVRAVLVRSSKVRRQLYALLLEAEARAERTTALEAPAAPPA